MSARGTFQQVGFALGIAIAGVIFFRYSAHPTPENMEAGVTGALLVAVAAFALAGIVSLFMPGRRQQQAADPTGLPEQAAAQR